MSQNTLCLLVAAVCTAGCDFARTPPSVDFTKSSLGDSVDLAAIKPQIDAFCGDCHATPLANSFPRDAWYHEVNRGYDFYYQSGRTDLRVPMKKDVYEYYRSQAPESLNIPQPDRSSPGNIKFRSQAVVIPSTSGRLASPAVSHLAWRTPTQVPALKSPTLIVSDMRLNQCQTISFGGGQLALRASRYISPIAHTEATDLNQDGCVDFIVSDLGSFLPEEHDRGRVLWMRTGEDGALLEPLELSVGLGRVADARPGDFDNDGDLDVVVAVFGLIKTGRIVLLQNETEDWESPRFTTKVVDARHGAIHVPVVDLNGDGFLDFVALISQEYETVEVFHNDGQGGFVNEAIFAATDPSYGSSGIELTDLDDDGDIDVLYTNGDMYDSFYVKPYHAIHWIENAGKSVWIDHLLAKMPGVFRALPGDLDGDGDKDIVASALVPDNALTTSHHFDLDSIVWLEQVRRGEFTYHTLEKHKTYHAALEVADFDLDGDVDFAVGNFRDQADASVDVWWNETNASALIVNERVSAE